MSQITAEQVNFLVAGIGKLVRGAEGAGGPKRCLARRELDAWLANLRKPDGGRWLRKIRTSDIYRSLEGAGVLATILSATEPVPADQLFAIGLDADPSRLDPLELLAALEPKGVACYFTAMSIHGLTTQFPPHHHIATPIIREVSASKAPAPAYKSPPPLGTWRYTTGGLTYYSTKRTAQLMPGIERRILSEYLELECTTVEQTLIDALMHPFPSGGEAVVLEAWERASGVSSLQKLIDLAATIPHEGLRRRTGYMLEAFMGVEELEMEAYANLRGEADHAIPLLQGFSYQRLDSRWQLLIP